MIQEPKANKEHKGQLEKGAHKENVDQKVIMVYKVQKETPVLLVYLYLARGEKEALKVMLDLKVSKESKDPQVHKVKGVKEANEDPQVVSVDIVNN